MSNVLRLPQVKAIKVGLSRSSIYAAVAQGKFPNPIRLGARAVGWLESDVDKWVSQQVRTQPEIIMSTLLSNAPKAPADNHLGCLITCSVDELRPHPSLVRLNIVPSAHDLSAAMRQSS